MRQLFSPESPNGVMGAPRSGFSAGKVGGRIFSRDAKLLFHIAMGIDNGH
jgi:hypothetical protein